MLLRVLSKDINSYYQVIMEGMYKVIPKCTQKHLNSIYRNLLLDVYQFWLYFNEVQEAKLFLITTVVENNFFTTENVLTVIGIYAPNGTTVEDLNQIKSSLQPFAEKYKCTKIDFLVYYKQAEELFTKLQPSFKASYYQLDLN